MGVIGTRGDPWAPMSIPWQLWVRMGTRHFIIIESRINRDSRDSPVNARIRVLPLVHRHCPTCMGDPCMRGLLLHSPRHQQQLRLGAPHPAEGGAAAADAGGHARGAMPVHEREPVLRDERGVPRISMITNPELDYNQMSDTLTTESLTLARNLDMFDKI